MFIEFRKLGRVAAVDGSLFLNGEDIGFLLFEEVFIDMFEDKDDDPEIYFAKHRIIRLILDSRTGFHSKKLLSYFDKLLIQAIDSRHI